MITLNTTRFSSSQPAIAPKFGIIRKFLPSARINLVKSLVHTKPGTFQFQLLRLQAKFIQLRETGLRFLSDVDDRLFGLRFDLATCKLLRSK